MRKSQPNIQNLFTHTADGARILQAFREARLQPTSKQLGATTMQLEMRKANYDRFLKLIRTGGWQALPPIILDLKRMALAQGKSLHETGRIEQGAEITVIITDTTHITPPRLVLRLPVAETRNSSVYVAIFTPSNGNAPFVYGVFRSEDFAREHWQQHGDKEGTLRVTHETLLERRGDWVSGTVKGEPGRMRHPQHSQIPKEEHENTFQHWQQPTYPGIKRYTTQDRSLGREGRQDTGLSLQAVGEITDWTEGELDAISSLQVGASVTVGGIHVTRTE